MGDGNGWLRPPRLATGEKRSATRLELFYDLAYVLVVAELASALLKDMSWTGVGIFAGLFTVMWFSWVSTTLYANRFDTDDVLFRIAILTDTAAVAGCAAAATGGLSGFDIPFAVCFLIGRLILVGLYVRAWWHVRDSRATVVVYLTGTSISATLWAVSLLVPAPARYILWGVSVLVEAASPFIATWRGNTAPLHMEHLPERFGLFVILVLGEVVAGIVTGVHDAVWASPSVTVAAVAFVVGAGLWWNYFDAASVSGEDELQDGAEEDGEEKEVDERHDLYIYGHLPLSLGIAATGVGLEDLVLHPDAGLPSPAMWIAVCGVALAMLGAGIVLGGVHQRISAMWPWPVAALVPLGALTFLDVPVLALVAMLAAVVVLFAIAGARQRRNRSSRTSDPAPAAGTD
ncbi:low temperature requirement protein A [Pseudonocardia lacus]|uniref:low temperature requirement protein A n=1 Tax=Pseudonocardia lacus TaxID=2835865 RepID=UPI001BDD27AD|nr:low temperature requirement protein A [Pseudonocardia lacus]